MPRAIVIRTAGTNCEQELVRAFRLAGAQVDLLHIDRLIDDSRPIERADLIGFPGGFSYGDDIASGRILAMKIRENLWPQLREAAVRGAGMIGVCNGFQVMVQVGLLPGPMPGERWSDRPPAQSLALAHNAGGRFVDCWTGVEVPANSVCMWTAPWKSTFTPHELMMPNAHGEGRIVAASEELLDQIERNGQVAVRYRENFNGSARGVAGVCDVGGRIFGLMPHPERFLDWTRHPFWTRLDGQAGRVTPGLALFRSAVCSLQGQPA
ncbi:MAG: phosphoribosylformylglycinamidine synthase subunit PurQ [Leptolyngbya sp. PLA3]|nr:MAG: phosphoribosylformylglycinamidine synthase subunit PurQ [Cyanobacteria bacterium CYA]MCE7969292.1 phosphoribosylformylglycinamidine synthase subunit PurQ [Leptolyngbya sp. PL-A3]